MAATCPNVGKIAFLDEYIAVENFTIHLFKNVVVIDRDTVVGDLTEADYDGYADQAAAAWTAAAIDADNYASSTAAALTWTKAAGANNNTVYGWYMLDQANELILAENFPTGPILMNAAGNSFMFSPVLKGGSIVNN